MRHLPNPSSAFDISRDNRTYKDRIVEEDRHHRTSWEIEGCHRAPPNQS